MREIILKAVANPPKILWGPFLPTLLNIVLQFPVMFIALGVFDMNPLLFLVTIVVGHFGVVYAGIREPHISTMITAIGKDNKISTNLYSEKGNKFAP